MKLLEALENKDQYFAADIGRKTQQWIAYGAAGFALMSSVFVLGPWGIVIAVLFLCATVWPAAVGRVIAMLTIVFSGVIIAMGDSTGNSYIRPLLALATIPLIMVSAMLASERLAGTIAVTCIYIWRKMTGRGNLRA